MANSGRASQRRARARRGDPPNLDVADAGELNTAARRQLARQGKAMDDGSYPIRNRADLDKAINAVGRGSGSHNAIRRHIIKRARALGLTSMLPDNWASSGKLES